MKNILVTGGAGFIGSNLIEHCLHRNHDINIMNLDKLSYASNPHNLVKIDGNSRYQFIHGNIADEQLINSIIRDHDIDTIIHLAAESHVDRSIESPDEFVQTNVVGTTNLLEQARAIWSEKYKLNHNRCHFHYVSTDEVFGSLHNNDSAKHETDLYNPSSPYSASKACGNHIVSAYRRTYGLPITTNYCTNNFGPHQHVEKFIPTVVQHCKNQTNIPIYGNGQQIRDWLYVADHCDAIYKIVTQGDVGESYNVTANKPLSNIALANMICERFNHLYPDNEPHQELITFVDDRPGHDQRYALDSHRIETELGWYSSSDFDNALDETIRYYL